MSEVAVIPDEVTVRRKLDQLKEEMKFLRRQLALSQKYRDLRDAQIPTAPPKDCDPVVICPNPNAAKATPALEIAG